MALSNFPNGITSFGIPVMGGDVPTSTGNYWFVNSAGNLGDGMTPSAPFTTIAAAISAATANNGDVIIVAPQHAETISGAAGIAFSKAGLTYYFCGEGANRPTFTFTATASTMTVTGASTKWTGAKPILVAAIDSIVTMLSVSAANCTLAYEHQDTSAAVEAISSITTTADANNLTVDLTYRGFPAGNATVNPVKLVGCDNGDITVDFYGIASTAVVNFVTTASTNINVSGYIYNSTDTTGAKLVVDTVGGSTWFASVYAGAAGAMFSGGSGAAIATDDVQALLAVPTADVTTNAYERDVVGNKTDAAVTAVGTTKSIAAYAKGLVTMNTVQSADSTANAFAGDVVGNKTDAAVYVPGTTKSLAAYAKGTANLQENVAFKSAATMVNGNTIFTVAGGPIQILSLASVCVTNNDATASTLQYSVTPTSGSAQTISAASASLANATAGASVTLAGTALATAALYNANGPNLIANPGTVFCPAGTITMVIGTGSTTGTWAHYIRYKPLAVGVTVS